MTGLIGASVPEWSLVIITGAAVGLGSWALKVLVDIRSELSGMASTLVSTLARVDRHEHLLSDHEHQLSDHHGRISALEAQT